MRSSSSSIMRSSSSSSSHTRKVLKPSVMRATCEYFRISAVDGSVRWCAIYIVVWKRCAQRKRSGAQACVTEKQNQRTQKTCVTKKTEKTCAAKTEWRASSGCLKKLRLRGSRDVVEDEVVEDAGSWDDDEE
eukprot:9470515-Pyramimonas_sp.AAC.1